MPLQAGPAGLLGRFASSALRASQAFLQDMMDRGTGSILFTGGGWALYPTASAASPSIGKAALRNLGFVLHEQLQGTGVRAGLVSILGMVDESTAFNSSDIGQAFLDFHRTEEAVGAEFQFTGS